MIENASALEGAARQQQMFGQIASGRRHRDFDQSVDYRLVKHGYPPGTAQRILSERDKAKHPDCLARVLLIASELRSRYELADLEGTNRQRRA